MDGFDMQSQAELNHWMAQTIQYALISGGRDEIEEEEVHKVVKQVVQKMPARINMPLVASGILKQAALLFDPTIFSGGIIESERKMFLNPDDLVHVMQWVLKSVAVINIARRKPFDHEKLEATADSIVGSIQGNKQHPTRADLDEVVLKTVKWGLEQLSKMN